MEKKIRSYIVENLIGNLDLLKKQVIGIAELPYNGKELLLEWSAGNTYKTTLVHTIRITNMGGVQKTHIEIPSEFIKLFPEGKSLYDMIQDPFEFNQWCKENGIN